MAAAQDIGSSGARDAGDRMGAADHAAVEAEPPLGPQVEGWTRREKPSRNPMVGRTCRLEALDPAAHAPPLHRALSADADGRLWTYLAYGPFETEDAYRAHLAALGGGDDPLFFAICDAVTGEALGVASYLRIDPANGVVEIGHICLSPALSRTTASTEALFLMLARVFDELGYRRCEWKTNALNAASIAAAKRLGFTYEGTFRQAVISKGRNRDTAWFSMLDSEWPERKARIAAWLDPSNFDAAGRQRRPLAR